MSVDRPIYLDHHATTPCDPRVVEAMLPWFTERFGNPASRDHTLGNMARSAVEHARVQVADAISASAKEIVWTSGATESNNLAILGVARTRAAHGGHIVTVATEHKAVLDPVGVLAREGFTTTVLPVDAAGRVSASQVEAALRPDTLLVSVMAANNEIGTLQPIAEIGAVCRARGVLLHTDAAQALGKIPLDVGAMHVDLMSLSAHKAYGPKGVGALYVRRGRPLIRLQPLMHGGGHERGLRPGTLPVPLIVGFGVAATLAAQDVAGDGANRLATLRDRLWEGLRARVPGVTLNGAMAHRLPNNLNVSFAGVEAEALMMSMREVACSSGSACTSATLEPSHVLRALGVAPETAHTSLRFGVGRTTTTDEIDAVIDRLAVQVPRLRALNPLNDGEDGGADLRAIRYDRPLQ